MTAPIDYAALARAVRVKMQGRPQWKCAYECGLSESTFSRIANNKTSAVRTGVPKVESETVLAVCRWLGVPLQTFMPSQQVPPAETLDAIEWVLMRDATITFEQATRLSDMMRAAYRAVAKETS
jgi:transcriptional regulator with XRE-family HTH domain